MEKISISKAWWELYQPNTGIRDRVQQVLHSHQISESLVVDSVLNTIYETSTVPFATDMAHEFIRTLLEGGHAVTIWSQGDPVYQHAKIDHFGFHELYDQLQFIVSTDKCQALQDVASSFTDERFILIDDRAPFLRRSAQVLSVLPHMPATTTIHIDAQPNTNDSWNPDVLVKGVDTLLEKQYHNLFNLPSRVLCDFDRTLFDPDLFTNTIILPLLEKTIATHSY